jgi:APA family basic amino acid/polyamine antiporter
MWMTRALVVLTLGVLTFIVVTALPEVDAANIDVPASFARVGVRGVLESAGILFFAFAGYARIATLGEEVVDPARTIPRAVPIALGLVLALYALVMITALASTPDDALAASAAPLTLLVDAQHAWVVRAGAAVASLGVLLSLLAGISRTAFAMASNHDLPHALAAVHEGTKVPRTAQIAAGVIVTVVAALVDVRSAIGFSSFCVLVYYAIANAAAVRMGRTALGALGALGCVTVAFTLPWASVLAGVGVLTCGALAFAVLRRPSRAA